MGKHRKKKKINFSLTIQLYLRSHVGHILLSVHENGGNWAAVHCLQIIFFLLICTKQKGITE